MSLHQEPTAGLRKWQRDAIRVIATIRGNGGDKAFIAACPGAGKTRLTIAAWNIPQIRADCDVIVIMVPSRALKRQWRNEFRDNGVRAMDQVPNEHLERRAYQDEDMFDPERPVQIYTYAQVAANPDLFRILSNRHRIFAVMDEIHHADDQESYGEALLHGFSEASFKLMLSGTPFNTKGTRLAFCETDIVADDEGRPARKTRVDFAYAYGEALNASGAVDDPNVVRPVQFVRWNGTATWERLYLETNETISKTVTGARKTDPLWPLLDMQGLNLKKMLDSAVERLQEIRESQRNAGMLITAMDRDHCQQIAEYLQSQGIHDIVSVMYDTPNAHAEIERFDHGNHRVLIAIKMISEGVDIKRLRVGVYASNVLTQMFFIQFIGRFIRWDKSLPDTQYACVYVPEHKQLIKYATEIERMIQLAMLSMDGNQEGGPEKKPSVLVGINTDGRPNGIIERERQIPRDEAAFLRDVIFRASLSGIISEGLVKKILDAVVEGEPRVGEILKEEPGKDEETTLSKQNDKLVASCVRISENVGRPLSYGDVQILANNHVGIRQKDAFTPEHVLMQRREFLKSLLARIYEGKVDA